MFTVMVCLLWIREQQHVQAVGQPVFGDALDRGDALRARRGAAAAAAAASA